MILIILSFGSMGCEFDQTLEYRIDVKLEKHVNQFFIEAEKRGISLYKENLIVSLQDCYDCVGQSIKIGEQRLIKINKDDICWIENQNNSQTAIENLIFHELGHTLLNRQHNDPKYSIMASGLSLYEYANDSLKRTVLIDELFYSR